MKDLLRAVIVVGAAGCALVAASYWLPGMRPGEAVGANLGAGALFGVGVGAAAVAVGFGIRGAFTRPGERGRFALASLGIAVVVLGLFLVGGSAYS